MTTNIDLNKSLCNYFEEWIKIYKEGAVRTITKCSRKAPSFSYGDIRRLLFSLKLVNFYCVR